MGFASKLEDETERRGGEAKPPIARRLAYVFDAYGVTNKPGQTERLQFDAEAEAKLDVLLCQIEGALQRRQGAFDAIDRRRGKTISKALASHKAFAGNIEALVLFLVPYVRQMHGDNRRAWNRKIEQLKKAKYLY